MKKDPFVRLLILSRQEACNVEKRLVEILAFPLAEMMTNTPPGIAEEMIEHCLSRDWLKQGRQPIKYGDAISIGSIYWKYMSTEKAKKLRLNNHVVLPTYPDTAIVPMENTHEKSKLKQFSCT